MSGGKPIGSIDFTLFLVALDRVCFVLFGLFLVRNWCGRSFMAQTINYYFLLLTTERQARALSKLQTSRVPLPLLLDLKEPLRRPAAGTRLAESHRRNLRPIRARRPGHRQGLSRGAAHGQLRLQGLHRHW